MSIPQPFVAKIVQAGAGTGKTESLAKEIVSAALKFFALNKNRRPRFTATTFTEQATAELRERVLVIAERPEYHSQELMDFVRDQESLQIGTLHGVFSKFLRQSGVFIGLDPEFAVLTEDEEDALIAQVARKMLAEDPGMETLVDQYQFTPLLEMLKPLLNHYRLHQKGFSPVTHWKAVLDEESVQLLSALEDLSVRDFSDLTPAAQKTMQALAPLYKNLDRLKLDFQQLRSRFLEVVMPLKKPVAKGALENLKDQLAVIFEFKDKWQEDTYSYEINLKYDDLSLLLTNTVKILDEKLSEMKRLKGVVSFADLEFYTAELLKNFTHVKNQFVENCDFWFVDEFQDTSPLQKNILFQFFKKPLNAYFVGDPQQSIYLFRGADHTVFEQTKKLVQENNGVLESLEINYRSEPDLLRFMNSLFSPLKPKGQEEGKVLAKIHLLAKTVEEEKVVLKQIQDWLKEGFQFDDICVLTRTNKNAEMLAHSLSQAGIPVYVHSTGGFYDKREILDALSVLGFMTKPQDDILFCTLARSPWFQIADEKLVQWAKAAREKKSSIWNWLQENNKEWSTHFPITCLGAAIRSQQEKPLSVIFEEILEALGFFEFALVEDSSGRREANLRKLVSQLRQAETRSGFSATAFIEKSWPKQNERSDESEAASFIEPARVNLMTIHKSKGLKFNCVILPDCGKEAKVNHNPVELSPDGLFATQILSDLAEEKVSPLALKILKEERAERELAESMRLFYVGVTRAAHRLSLIAHEPLSPRSWLGRVKLDLSEDTHDSYQVKKWEKEDQVGAAGALPAEQLSESVVLTSVRKRKSQPPFTALEMKVDLKTLLDSQERGVILHAVFEEIRKWPQLPVSDVVEKTLSRFHQGAIQDKSIIQKTLELSHPPLKQIIKNGFPEWAFSFMHEGQVYSGRIDLWGTADDGTTWIIDYKSAKQLNTTLKKSVTEQLRFYALAVNKRGVPWEKIRLAAILPASQEVFEPDLGTQEEAIAGVLGSYRYLDRILRDQSAEQLPLQ